MKLSGEQGFTLLEMMAVLFIMSAVTGIIMLSFQYHYEQRQISQFFKELTQDLYLTQTYALTHYETTRLIFYPGQHYYVVKAADRSDPIVQNTYDDSIDVDPGNMGLVITFNMVSGNLSNGAGHLRIQTAHGRYNIVFHIGKGRFYVEKR